jgi:hypothetical protein
MADGDAKAEMERSKAHGAAYICATCDILLMDYIIRRLALDYHEIQVLVPLAQQKVVHTFRLV